MLQIISLQTPGLLYNIRGAAVGTSLDSTSEKESAWEYLCLTRMPQLFNYKTNKKHTNQWHHAEQNWLTNVAFWLRTSQWFSVVGSVVEHWLLKPGILGFRIPRSWWLFYIKKMSSFNANGSICIPGLKAFPCKVLPPSSEGLRGK